MKSLTCDRGKEMAEHERFTLAVCFCDPQSRWQRGSNENKILGYGNTGRAF